MNLFDLRSSLSLLRNWRPGRLAKGTLIMTFGIGMRTLGQALVFIVLARLLGVEAYGAYAAILAIAGTLGCFGGLGVQTVMLRDIARNPAVFPRVWGRTLVSIGCSAPLLLAGYCLLAWMALPPNMSWLAIASIGAAELVFIPVAFAGSNAYQGGEKIGKAAWLTITPIISRLIGVLLLLLCMGRMAWFSPLELWAVIYLLAAGASALHAVHIVSRDLGKPHLLGKIIYFDTIKDGLLFAAVGAAQKLYADIDKTMVARLSGLEAAGLYSAAYRVMDMATIPVAALITVALPRFFQANASSRQVSSCTPWALFPAPAVYAVTIGLLCHFAAAWLPLLLGPSFQPAVIAVQWLAWLPLVSLPRLLLQTSLVTGMHKRAVVAVLGAGSAVNIVLNGLLIPALGWRGAILATYATEVGMGAMLVWRTRSRQTIKNVH